MMSRTRHRFCQGIARPRAPRWRVIGALALVAVAPASGQGGYIGSLAGGFDQRVYAVALHEGALVAAGVFDKTAAGTGALGRIARYGPEGWEPLGAPAVQGEVRCLLSLGGDLIAGGDFYAVGGVPARAIARWDGGAWAPLGDGMRGGVRVLAGYDGELLAGGDFSMAGGSPCHALARWDGAQWHALGLGAGTGQVRALAAFQGSLYVGGTGIELPGDPSGRHALVRWDGAAWHAVGGGLEHGELAVVDGVSLGMPTPASVLALTEYDGRLVIGGQFRRAFNGPQSIEADGLVQWDGSEFATVGGASLGQSDDAGAMAPTGTRSAFALVVHEGRLVVAGAFIGLYLDGVWHDLGFNVTLWNGLVWENPDPSGSRLDITYTAAATAGEVVFGGHTTVLRGLPVGYIVKWSPGATGVAGEEPARQPPAILAGAYPNPFHPRSTLWFALPKPGRSRLVIHDLAGRRVRVLDDSWRSAGVHFVAWDGKDDAGRPVASGVYCIQLDAAAGRASSRLTLLR